MKSLFASAILIACMIFPATVHAQSSGTTPPPPPVCSSSNAGAIYTDTATTPPTVYTCSYYNLVWQWVVNPSYGGLVYYPTVPSTCSGALPVFLAGWPITQMYLCESGVPKAVANGLTVPIAITSGGTGASTAGGALQNLDAAIASYTGTADPPSQSCTGVAWVDLGEFATSTTDKLYQCLSGGWTLVGGAGCSTGGCTMTGPLAAPSINKVLYVGTPGGYANLAAANAAAIAAGGGTIITPPGYTETLSNIVIGASGASVFWSAGTGTMITVTGTTGIQFYSGSGSSCDVPKSCHIITAQTSGSPISLVSNYPQDGTGGSIFLDGWFIDGGSEAVSFSDAEVSLGNVFANSYLRDVSIERCGANIGLHVTSTVSTGGGTNVIYIDNPNIGCDDNYGARPLVVDFSGTGQLSAVTIEGGTVENPGCGQHGATFDGHGSVYKLYSILWEGTQIQGNPCTSPPVTTITGYSVSSDVVTLSYTGQKPAIGLTGTFSGLSIATFLNGKALPVLPAGLTSSTFEVAYVTGNVGTTSDSGSFTPSEVSDMYVVDTQAMTIIGSDEANGGESAAVELNQTVTNGLGSIVIENVRSGGGSLPPVINDVSGYQTPAGTYIEPLYVYPGSGAAAPATFDGTTAFTQPVALAVQAEGPQSVSGPNLVPNGNFQTGYPGSVATGWTLSGNGGATCTGLLDNTTYPPINTTNSQKVTISGSTGSCTLTSGSFAVSSGKQYQVAVWMRNDGSVMSFSGYTGLYNSSGVLICQPVWNGGWPTLTTSWVQVTGECTATGSDAAAVFKIPYTLGYGSVWIGNVWSAAQSLPPVPGWGNAVSYSVAGTDTLVQTSDGTVASGYLLEGDANGGATNGPLASSITTPANLAGGAAGSIPYQSAASTTAFLAGNTAATDQVIVSHGTGSAAQAPTLSNAPALSAANMTSFPILNQATTSTAAGLSGTPNLPTGTTINATPATSDNSTKAQTTAGTLAQIAANAPTTLFAHAASYSTSAASTNETNVGVYTMPAGTMVTPARLHMSAAVGTPGSDTGNCEVLIRASTTSGDTSGGTVIGHATTGNGAYNLAILQTDWSSLSSSSQSFSFFGVSNALLVSGSATGFNTSTTTVYLNFNVTSSTASYGCNLSSIYVELHPQG